MTDIPAVLATIDTGRLIELVQEVCRIPSVLGEEGPLAAFLHDLMRESGFEATELQPVIGDRPNALGELSFGAGPRVVFTGHMDTKPVSHGWTAAEPFSGDLIDGVVYGHGIMDMKAALVCQIVAHGGAARLRPAAVRHAGDGGGLRPHGRPDRLDRLLRQPPRDMAVLGELSDNEIFLGHRGRYYFDVTVLGTSAHTCHKPLAVNANLLAAHAVIELDGSRLMPPLDPASRGAVRPGDVHVARPHLRRPAAGRPVDDPRRVRDPGRLPPAARRHTEQVRAEIDRCLAEAAAATPRSEPSVELVDVKSGYLAAPGDPVVTLMTTRSADVRGTEPSHHVAGWLGDTASFGAKVPTVIFGPGGEPVYCPDEHLSRRRHRRGDPGLRRLRRPRADPARRRLTCRPGSSWPSLVSMVTTAA